MLGCLCGTPRGACLIRRRKGEPPSSTCGLPRRCVEGRSKPQSRRYLLRRPSDQRRAASLITAAVARFDVVTGTSWMRFVRERATTALCLEHPARARKGFNAWGARKEFLLATRAGSNRAGRRGESRSRCCARTFRHNARRHAPPAGPMRCRARACGRNHHRLP